MQPMEPSASSEARTALGETREAREFEEREDWDPAPEEEFLRDTLEIVGADDLADEDDDVSWA